MVFGQIQTTLNFYFYGKRHFTQTGYEKNVSEYEDKSFLDRIETLNDKVYAITGANSGIGKEMALYLAKKQAVVFMICRSKERAEAARDDVIKQSGNEKVIFLQADVSLEEDVRRVVREMASHPLCSSSNSKNEPQLNGLICNAGALLHEFTPTKEGFETTFAAHLLFGTYLLGDLCMPLLKSTKDSRCIIVSSGGMYNYALPSWEILSSTNEKSIDKYDGQKAYAFAKRGQVILAEKWAIEHPEVKIVTAHPGWTLSEGVEAAYGENKSYLQPLRTCWEGAEGICWLATVPSVKIHSGAFYLDRSTQPKHIAGAFWYEGTATKNTDEEMDMFYENLKRWASADAEKAMTKIWRPTLERINFKYKSREMYPKSIPCTEKSFELEQFMKKWHVLAHIPIMAVDEQKLANPYEHYEYDSASDCINVNFTSTPLDTQVSQLAKMHGYVQNKPINSHWFLNPKLYFYLPLRLDYIMIHVEDDYEWTLVGVPSRDNLWIMTRKRPTHKDASPWPSNVPENFRTANGGCQGITGAEVDCMLEDKVEPVFDGVGRDYSDDRTEKMTINEEKDILKKGLLLAEQNGFDISQVRMCGWRVDIP